MASGRAFWPVKLRDGGYLLSYPVCEATSASAVPRRGSMLVNADAVEFRRGADGIRHVMKAVTAGEVRAVLGHVQKIPNRRAH